MARLSESLMNQLANVPNPTQVDVGGSLLSGIERGQVMRGRNELSELRQQAMLTNQQRQVILGQNIKSNEVSAQTQQANQQRQQEFMQGQKEIFQRHGNDPKSPGLQEELAVHGAQFLTDPKDAAAYWKAVNAMTPKEKADYTSSLTEGRQIRQGNRTNTRTKAAEERAAGRLVDKRAQDLATKEAAEKRAESRSDMPLSIRQSFEDPVLNADGTPKTDPFTGKNSTNRNIEEQDAYAAFKGVSGVGWHKAKAVWDKFNADPAMEGKTIGKKTDEGFEVSEDGAVVGHYN